MMNAVEKLHSTEPAAPAIAFSDPLGSERRVQLPIKRAFSSREPASASLENGLLRTNRNEKNLSDQSHV
jgi:hypothetical protein